MEGNWCAHFPPLHRVTPSPASWTWRLILYHLLRMTRFGQIYTVSIPQIESCACLIFVCLFSFSFRSQSWHLKVWSLMNYILVCYSTAVTLERRYSVYCTDLLDLLFIWIRFIISMGNVKYLETQAATHIGFDLTSYYCIIAALGYTCCFTCCTICFKNILYCKTPPNTWNSVLVTGGSEWSPDERHAQQSASWRPTLQSPGYCATRVNSASAASAPPVWPVVPAHKPVYSYPPGAHWSPAERR